MRGGEKNEWKRHVQTEFLEMAMHEEESQRIGQLSTSLFLVFSFYFLVVHILLIQDLTTLHKVKTRNGNQVVKTESLFSFL